MPFSPAATVLPAKAAPVAGLVDKDAPVAGLADKAGDEMLGMPRQAEELTRELYVWLLTDSLGLVGGVGLTAILYFLFLAGRSRARRRFGRHAQFGSWSWVALKVLSRTRSFFLLMAAVAITTRLFMPPATWADLIAFLFTVATAVQGAFWVREFLVALVERKAAGREGDATMSSAVGVLTVIINVVVWSIAAIILLDNLGVNVTALVAGLGVGGIAIGLAAQGIFSDLFAALSILLDQPFKRGDTIQVGGAQGFIGTVEHIGLKTTRFRALSGEMVVLSNANLLNQQINNFADFSHRRVVLLVQVIYQTDPALLEQIPRELEAIVTGVPRCRFDRAHLIQFSASALDYELVFLVDETGLDAMFAARQAVMLATIRRFGALGISFAFPTQVSLLAGADGLVIDPHPEAAVAGRPAALAAKTGVPRGKG